MIPSFDQIFLFTYQLPLFYVVFLRAHARARVCVCVGMGM